MVGIANSIGLMHVESLIAVLADVHDYININRLINVNKIIEYLYIVGTDIFIQLDLVKE